MNKSKILKVGIQFTCLRACCKNKSKDYFKNKNKNEKQRSEEKKREKKEKKQGDKKRLGEKKRPEKRSERGGECLFYDLQQAD